MPTTFSGFVDLIIVFINSLITGIFAFLFLYLVWKTIDSWIINAGEPAKREEGKRTMLLAVLMFALMLTTWGIVALIRDSFLPPVP